MIRLWHQWQAFLQECREGDLDQALSFAGFAAAAELPRLEAVADALRGLRPGRDNRPDRDNLEAVLRRLLLGRRDDLLEELPDFWPLAGVRPEVAAGAVHLARRARVAWPGRVIDDASAAYGPGARAHAEFAAALHRLKRDDPGGPFAGAVRTSRYDDGRGDPDRPWQQGEPWLEGESRHTGFAVVLRSPCPRLGDAAWVQPGPERDFAEWLDEGRRLFGSDGPWGRGWPELAERWRRQCQDTYAQVEPDLRGRRVRRDEERPVPTLPTWWLLFALGAEAATLESAGLALALQRLADRHGWRLPAGVGFTAALREGRLCGVRGLQQKLRAAREAGLFVLFACRDPDEPQPAPEAGVLLVLLEPHLSLREAVRRINRVCAALGLTSYRLDRVADPERTLARACPFGFVDRTSERSQLDQWEASGGRSGAASRAFLIGPPRSGKSTLLSRWLSDGPDPSRFPVRFAFRAGVEGRRALADLSDSVERQASAYYIAVPGVDVKADPAARLFLGLNEITKSVEGGIAVAIDGLDEAADEDRDAISAYVEKLGQVGRVLASSQPDGPMLRELERTPHRTSVVRILNKQGEAESLVLQAAESFRSPDRPATLRAEGERLVRQEWYEGLAQRFGGNLWALTHFLELLERNQGGLPERPDLVPVVREVWDYCRWVMDRTAPDAPGGAPSGWRFLVSLAILEERRWPGFLPEGNWPLAGVLRLAGLPDDDLPAWERFAAGARGVLAAGRQHVRFIDATFRLMLTDHHPEEQLRLAKRLLDLLPGMGESDFLGACAAANTARHLLGLPTDAPAAEVERPELARRLVLESGWAPARLRSFARSDRPVRELLEELADLRLLLRPGRDVAVDDLQTDLALWNVCIDRSRSCAAGWWRGLAAVQRHAVWRAKPVPSADTDCPTLLAPAGPPESPAPTYGTPHWIQSHFAGPVCELPGPAGSPGTLVFADVSGCLAVYAADGPTYRRRSLLPLGVRKVGDLAPLGPGEAIALVEDWSGRRQLLRVDVQRRLARPIAGPPGQLIACAALAPADHGTNRLVVAAWDGPRTRVWLLEDGRPDQRLSHELPFRASGLVAFADDAWAVYGIDFSGATGDALAVQRLEEGSIVEVTLHGWERLKKVDANFALGEVAPGPRNTLAVQIFFDSHPFTTVGLLYSREGGYLCRTQLSREGSGTAACPDYGAGPSLAYHDRLGLLMNNDVQGVIRQPFEADASPAYLPEELEKRIPGADGNIELPCGGLRLADGRVLLVCSRGGVLIDAAGHSTADIDDPWAGRDSDVLVLGIREDGAILTGSRRTLTSDELCSEDFDQLLVKVTADWHEELIPGDEAPGFDWIAKTVAPLASGKFDQLRVHFPPEAAPPAPVPPNVKRDGGVPLIGSDGARCRVECGRLYQEGDAGRRLIWDLRKLFSQGGGDPDNPFRGFRNVARHGGERFHVLDAAEAGTNLWRLRAAFVQGADGAFRLWVCDVNLDETSGTWSLSAPPAAIDLGDDEVRCCTAVDFGRVAIGYASGRIEVVAARPDSHGRKCVSAVAFTWSAPSDLRISHGPQGSYLVAVDGGLVWYKMAADG
jgi:hypothetical protein